MRFLKKVADSYIHLNNLNYADAGQRSTIRAELKKEQLGFCAYSERFIKHTDSVDIEHFDSRKKNTIDDDYYNWYATLHWLNSHKPNLIEPYLPILLPYDETINSRIKYENDLFIAIDNTDIEANNLIRFLGVNKHEVYSDRVRHIGRIRALRNLCGGNEDLFLKKMIEDQDNLSFATAIEYNFKLDVDNLIDMAINYNLQ